MTRYELLQDWRTMFSSIDKGTIKTIDDWQRGHGIFKGQIEGRPDWFRAVPECRVGDVVWHKNRKEIGVIITTDKRENDGFAIHLKTATDTFYTRDDLLTPAPPMPAEPVMYQGKPYRVERENGVPVFRKPVVGEVWVTIDLTTKRPYGAELATNEFTNSNARPYNGNRYILTPCEWAPKEGERYDFVTTKGLVSSTIYGQTDAIVTHQRRRDIGNCFEHDSLDPAKVREIMREAYARVKKEARK